MNETESMKQMIENAKQAGYLKGLLEGLLSAGISMGDYYHIRSEVFEKVKRECDKANINFGL